MRPLSAKTMIPCRTDRSILKVIVMLFGPVGRGVCWIVAIGFRLTKMQHGSHIQSTETKGLEEKLDDETSGSAGFSGIKKRDLLLLRDKPVILESVWQRTYYFLPGWLCACQPGLFDPKSVAAAQDHRSFDNVLQLADISRPCIRLAKFQRIAVDLADLLSSFFRVAFYEILYQYRNVLLPFAERRHLNRENVKPVKEVGSKRSCGNGF